MEKGAHASLVPSFPSGPLEEPAGAPGYSDGAAGAKRTRARSQIAAHSRAGLALSSHRPTTGRASRSEPEDGVREGLL